jgi:hypothetical protein
MNLWNSVLRKKAEDWTYLELGAEQVPTGVGHNTIPADTAYVTLALRALHIVNVRSGLKRFHGAVHSWSSVSHISDGRAEFQVVTTPAELKDADPDHIDRIIAMDKPLLGPLPYRGGGLDFEIGLFSVSSGDLVGPYLDVLESMSKVAGVTFISAALPFVEPLSQGISLLTGTSRDTLLEIGLAKSWEPTTGYYAIIRAPRGSLRLEDVRVAPDQRLTDSQGFAIRQYAYVVYSIDASRSRPNWFEIPELKKAYDDLNVEIRRGRVPDAEQAFEAFRRQALTSPDLLFEDAKLISQRVDAQVKEILGSKQTGGGAGGELPELRRFSPFDE